jgi:Zn-dependent metalloprotease
MPESTETTQNKPKNLPGDNTLSLPNEDPSVFLKDYKEYLAYQVAESARQQLVSWAKWIIGVIVILVTILGLKTYIDVQNKINEAIEQQLATARGKTKEALDEFTTETNAALDKLKTEADLVKTQADQAGTLISEQTTQVRSQYTLFMGALPGNFVPSSIAGLSRLIYDAKNKEILPGTLVRSEGTAVSSDQTVNEVYDNLAIVYKFLNEKLGINMSLKENKIIATVHFGRNYDNLYWDGTQVVVGDGDGKTFIKFSGLTGIAHVIGISIVQSKANLRMMGQSGSLKLHISDVIAVMADQYHQGQIAGSASWLIGADMFSPNVKGALRSMKAPGTAYDNPLMGKDPQPAHMKDYIKTDQDTGGVHLNSGIPNHAFYLASVAVGGFSWDKIGTIWMKSMDYIKPDTDFEGFATITFQTAQNLYRNDSNEAKAVEKAWSDVGISVHAKQTRSEPNSNHKPK